MIDFPENIMIDIAAATKNFEYVFKQASNYIDAMLKVWSMWRPIVSMSHRTRVKAVHTAYHQRQKARRRRKQ